MILRTVLTADAASACLLWSAAVAHAADDKEIQMLHWWTSGGEAAALNVLKEL